VSIGETLARARQQAGLTVAEASMRTRQAIIYAIEQDDFAACGGDFYARGHIRALARAAGIDPRPLVEEYDRIWGCPDDTITDVSGLVTASRAAQGPGSQQGTGPRGQAGTGRAGAGHAEEARAGLWLPRLPGRGTRQACRFRRNWPLALAAAVVVAAGITGFALLSGFGQPAPVASQPVQAAGPAGGSTAGHTGQGRRAVTPAQPSPSTSAVRNSPQASPPRVLPPASAQAFGPGGSGTGDNAGLAPLAIDPSMATAWHTDWYTTARFGNLYGGTGLLLDMGHRVTITRAWITLGGAPGAQLQLRVGQAPELTALPPVARAASAGGVLRLRLARPARGRYVLIWFTRLPPGPAGAFEASVHDVRLAGTG
jgi:hypothetical protein